MKNQSPSTRPAAKTPTTQTVVSKVQSITAKKNEGRQAEWTRNLQRTVDTKLRPVAQAAPSQKTDTPRPGQAEKQGSTISTGAKHVDRKDSPPHPQPTTSSPQKQRNPANDNHSNQLNTTNEQFYKSRGLPGRPTDWKESTEAISGKQKPNIKPSK